MPIHAEAGLTFIDDIRSPGIARRRSKLADAGLQPIKPFNPPNLVDLVQRGWEQREKAEIERSQKTHREQMRERHPWY